MYCTLVREQYMPFLFIVLLRGNSVVFFRFALSRQTLPHKRSGIANSGQAALHAMQRLHNKQQKDDQNQHTAHIQTFQEPSQQRDRRTGQNQHTAPQHTMSHGERLAHIPQYRHANSQQQQRCQGGQGADGQLK